MLPLADRSCHVILGDGCFAALRYAQRFDLARSIARVLRDDAPFVLRMFVRPDVDDRPDDVWGRLVAGGFGSFHVFKFHVLMSLRDANGDVCVNDAWEFFDSRCASVTGLAERLGWSVDVIETIGAYRNQATVYWFPSLAQQREVFQGVFDELACTWPRYEMGDRCPTFVLRRSN
jgi:hypothetical protein